MPVNKDSFILLIFHPKRVRWERRENFPACETSSHLSKEGKREFAHKSGTICCHEKKGVARAKKNLTEETEN